MTTDFDSVYADHARRTYAESGKDYVAARARIIRERQEAAIGSERRYFANAALAVLEHMRRDGWLD